MENKELHLGPTKEKFKDWMAMWHVEIDERERHLNPDKWLVTGWYAYEKYLFKNVEYQWEKEEAKYWENFTGPHGEVIDGVEYHYHYAEDPLHWNIVHYIWSLHKDGIWRKGFLSDGGYTGIFDSYEEAIATLAKLPAMPNRFEDYENHLEEALKRKKAINDKNI